MPNNEARQLAELMDETRQAMLRDLDRLQGSDLHHRFAVNGIQLNSAYWIAAHLAVSQNWLTLRATGGPFRKFSWAKYFSLGTTPQDVERCPPFVAVRSMLDEIHGLALIHLSSLDEQALSAPHQGLMTLPGRNDVRSILRHHLRHESGHGGQLSWLCRLHGSETL